MAGPSRTCPLWDPRERAEITSSAAATASSEVPTAAGDGKPCICLSSDYGEHEVMGISLSALPTTRSSPAAVGASRVDGAERGLHLAHAAAASPPCQSNEDDPSIGCGCYDAADKVVGAECCGHANRRDQAEGRGNSLTVFRVVSCVHPTRKVAPGSVVHALLGRNLYILWSTSRRGAPSTVDAFRAARPS